MSPRQARVSSASLSGGAIPHQHPRLIEQPKRVLLVSRFAEDHLFLRRILAGPEWLLTDADTLAAAEEALERCTFAVAICDADLPDGAWRDFLRLAGSRKPAPEVIVASRLADASLWSEALNTGAWDVLSKPFSAREVDYVTGCAAQQWDRLHRAATAQVA